MRKPHLENSLAIANPFRHQTRNDADIAGLDIIWHIWLHLLATFSNLISQRVCIQQFSTLSNILSRPERATHWNKAGEDFH
jgi:hypothetical protein